MVDGRSGPTVGERGSFRIILKRIVLPRNLVLHEVILAIITIRDDSPILSRDGGSAGSGRGLPIGDETSSVRGTGITRLVGDEVMLTTDGWILNNDECDTTECKRESTMKTATIARGVAVVLAWAAISGFASAQALGSTTAKEPEVTTLERVATEEAGFAGQAEAVERMGAWLGTLDAIRSDLAKNDGFIRSDDELVLALLFEPMEGESKLLRQYMKSVVTAMDAVPDTFYTRLDATLEALWAEIRRVAPTVAPVKGRDADAVMRAAITGRVAQGAPEATIVRAVLTGDRWTVRMTDGGLPRSEYRRGYVMYRLPNQELVICQQMVVERPYFGSAERADDYTVRLGYLRLQDASK